MQGARQGDAPVKSSASAGGPQASRWSRAAAGGADEHGNEEGLDLHATGLRYEISAQSTEMSRTEKTLGVDPIQVEFRHPGVEWIQRDRLESRALASMHELFVSAAAEEVRRHTQYNSAEHFTGPRGDRWARHTQGSL